MKNKPGKLTKEPDGYQLRFERTLPYSIETVWEAITDPAKLKVWFTDIDMDFRDGGRMEIRFRDEKGTVSPAEILSIDPPRRFEFSWEGELVCWELSPLGKEQCQLVLLHKRITPPYVVGSAGGFHTLLDRLQAMLDGDTRTYPFGTEENDPLQAQLRKEYGEKILEEFPALLRYEPIIVEKYFNASPARIWKAITDRDEMKKWYFDLSSFRPEPGFEFEFYGQGHKGEQYLHKCRVVEVVPERKLSYSWRYDGFEGDSTVTFELFPEGDRTRLVLTHRGLGSFPADNPDFARESFSAGWNELIGVLLEKYLEG